MSAELTTDRLSFATITTVTFSGESGSGLEPLPPHTLVEVLDAAASAGFGWIGLDTFSLARYLDDGGDPVRLREEIRRRGLRCSDLGALRMGDPGGESKQLKLLIPFAEALGPASASWLSMESQTMPCSLGWPVMRDPSPP